MRIFGNGKCKFIANFSATMVTSLPSHYFRFTTSVSLLPSHYFRLTLSLSHRLYLTHSIGSASALPIMSKTKNLSIKQAMSTDRLSPCQKKLLWQQPLDSAVQSLFYVFFVNLKTLSRLVLVFSHHESKHGRCDEQDLLESDVCLPFLNCTFSGYGSPTWRALKPTKSCFFSHSPKVATNTVRGLR